MVLFFRLMAAGSLTRQTSRGILKSRPIESGADEYPADWSRDGRYIALTFSDWRGQTPNGIRGLPLFGDRKPSPYLEFHPRCSPPPRETCHLPPPLGNGERLTETRSITSHLVER
jgi:hypothetical protein